MRVPGRGWLRSPGSRFSGRSHPGCSSTTGSKGTRRRLLRKWQRVSREYWPAPTPLRLTGLRGVLDHPHDQPGVDARPAPALHLFLVLACHGDQKRERGGKILRNRNQIVNSSWYE